MERYSQTNNRRRMERGTQEKEATGKTW